MRRPIISFIILLFLLGVLPCLAERPTVKAGPYVIKVDSLARVLDLTNFPNTQNFTLITLTLEAPPAAMEKLLEVAQDPVATDDTGQSLTFQEIRFPGKEKTDSGKMQAQILFSAPGDSATALQDFAAHLVFYEKRESLRLDFLCVAGEKPASQMLDSLVVAPEFLAPQEGRAYRVSVEVKMPMEKPDPTNMWTNEQVELIDSEGHPQSALSTLRTYKYDDTGQVIATVMTATFVRPTQPPRGLRYRVDRLRGVQVLSYRFKDLPLP